MQGVDAGMVAFEVLVAAAVAGALVVGMASGASAAKPGPDPSAGRIVEQVAGTGDIVAGSPTSAAASQATVTTGQGTGTVTVPRQSSGPVAVTGADGSTLALGLPQTREVAGAATAAGTVVYPDAAPHTDIAVQPTADGGARALVTLKNSKAPTEHRFPLTLPDGARLAPDNDGGYSVVTTAADGTETVIGAVDAPWAKDRNGHLVPTRYKLDGTTLVQTVDTNRDTAYPVVADPKVSIGWYLYIRFSKWEVRNYFKAGVGGLAMLGASVCSRIPGPAQGACWLMVGSAGWGVMKWVEQHWNPNCGLEIKYRGTIRGKKNYCS